MWMPRLITILIVALTLSQTPVITQALAEQMLDLGKIREEMNPDRKKKAYEKEKMRKNFNIVIENNPLLKEEDAVIFQTIRTVTKGYCDKRARYNLDKCFELIYGSVRGWSGDYKTYGQNDFRDPRVYERAYRYYQSKRSTSPLDHKIMSRDYGYYLNEGGHGSRQ